MAISHGSYYIIMLGYSNLYNHPKVLNVIWIIWSICCFLKCCNKTTYIFKMLSIGRIFLFHNDQSLNVHAWRESQTLSRQQLWWNYSRFCASIFGTFNSEPVFSQTDLDRSWCFAAPISFLASFANFWKFSNFID